MGRILAIDPGEKRIGLALSDPLRLIATPLQVLEHQSREADVQKILSIVREHEVDCILVGLALDQDGRVGFQARRALRFVEAIQAQTDLPVVTWDESGTTRAAFRGPEADGSLDARAAAYLLQDYLHAQNP